MPSYAEHGIRWAWLLDPLARTLEVYALDDGSRWRKPTVYGAEDRVHAVPFEAIELNLAVLWST